MLSHKVVIVQAFKDSGAIYTATCGLKYNKEVMQYQETYMINHEIPDQHLGGLKLIRNFYSKLTLVYFINNLLLSNINIYSVTYRKSFKKIVAPASNWMLIIFYLKLLKYIIQIYF